MSKVESSMFSGILDIFSYKPKNQVNSLNDFIDQVDDYAYAYPNEVKEIAIEYYKKNGLIQNSIEYTLGIALCIYNRKKEEEKLPSLTPLLIFKGK